ncbi:hypothetical protein ACFVVP_39205 [Streptomyces sp. NPDC058128]|uniref:hypothetical protein n=1 Tax=Streptomyces sp. NPDC058128 TaxID=3346352 RepID=UPI0036E943CD
MQPTYSARMFFYGAEDGDPRGLADIRSWEDMDPGRAAQEVQRSAYPDLYAGQEDAADASPTRQGSTSTAPAVTE